MRFLEDNYAFLVGFGLCGMVSTGPYWFRFTCAIVAAVGIVLKRER